MNKHTLTIDLLRFQSNGIAIIFHTFLLILPYYYNNPSVIDEFLLLLLPLFSLITTLLSVLELAGVDTNVTRFFIPGVIPGVLPPTLVLAIVRGVYDCHDSLNLRATNREYGMVAKAYNAIKEKGDKRVLFVRIAIDNNQRIFQYHDFKTAPIITYLPANEVMEKKV